MVLVLLVGKDYAKCIFLKAYGLIKVYQIQRHRRLNLLNLIIANQECCPLLWVRGQIGYFVQ